MLMMYQHDHFAPANRHSPPVIKTTPIQRSRPTTACLTCRDRRVKCDRIKPCCGQCKKGQRACEYANNDVMVNFSDHQPASTARLGGHAPPIPSRDNQHREPSPRSLPPPLPPTATVAATTSAHSSPALLHRRLSPSMMDPRRVALPSSFRGGRPEGTASGFVPAAEIDAPSSSAGLQRSPMSEPLRLARVGRTGHYPTPSGDPRYGPGGDAAGASRMPQAGHPLSRKRAGSPISSLAGVDSWTSMAKRHATVVRRASASQPETPFARPLPESHGMLGGPGRPHAFDAPHLSRPQVGGPQQAFVIASLGEHFWNRVREELPPPDECYQLLDQYSISIQPLLPVCHLPSLRQDFRTLIGELSPRSPLDRLALAQAVISISSTATEHVPTENRHQPSQDMLETILRTVDVAQLARVDAAAMLCLMQALLIHAVHMISIRLPSAVEHIMPRLINMASALRLSLDVPGINAVETEVRRRCWWQLVLVDVELAVRTGGTTHIRPHGHTVPFPSMYLDTHIKIDAGHPVGRIPQGLGGTGPLNPMMVAMQGQYHFAYRMLAWLDCAPTIAELHDFGGVMESIRDSVPNTPENQWSRALVRLILERSLCLVGPRCEKLDHIRSTNCRDDVINAARQFLTHHRTLSNHAGAAQSLWFLPRSIRTLHALFIVLAHLDGCSYVREERALLEEMINEAMMYLYLVSELRLSKTTTSLLTLYMHVFQKHGWIVPAELLRHWKSLNAPPPLDVHVVKEEVQDQDANPRLAGAGETTPVKGTTEKAGAVDHKDTGSEQLASMVAVSPARSAHSRASPTVDTTVDEKAAETSSTPSTKANAPDARMLPSISALLDRSSITVTTKPMVKTGHAASTDRDAVMVSSRRESVAPAEKRTALPDVPGSPSSKETDESSAQPSQEARGDAAPAEVSASASTNPAAPAVPAPVPAPARIKLPSFASMANLADPTERSRGSGDSTPHDLEHLHQHQHQHQPPPPPRSPPLFGSREETVAGTRTGAGAGFPTQLSSAAPPAPLTLDQIWQLSVVELARGEE